MKINEDYSKNNLIQEANNLNNYIDNYVDYLAKNVFLEKDWHYTPEELKGVIAIVLKDKNFTYGNLLDDLEINEETKYAKRTIELD